MNNKKLSVLVPVYNVQHHLERCIDKLKKQTYKNIEVIFVEDKSTDRSLDVLVELTKDMPNAKIIKHEENKGLFLARVTGLLNCTGDYIAFCDSDDFMDDNFYETYMNIITENDADICLCDYRYVREDNKPTIEVGPKEKINLVGEQCFKYFCHGTGSKNKFLYMWTKLIKRCVFEKSKQDLLSVVKDTYRLVGGEENIFSILFISNAQKIVNGYGSCYSYYIHPDQSVNLNSKERFLKQAESFIRGNIITRQLAIKNNLYDDYYAIDKRWLRGLTKENWVLALKLGCSDKFNEILKKYNFKNILEDVQQYLTKKQV